MSIQRKADDVGAGDRPAPSALGMSLTRLLSVISTSTSIVSGLLFLFMTGLVIVQVIFRYVLNQPLIGSEEGARIAMIYVVLLGAALCMRSGGHMAVTYFRDLASPRVALALDMVVALLIMIFGLILIFKGFEFSQRSMSQTTPALQIPKGYVIWAFPVSGILMILFTVESFIRSFVGLPPLRYNPELEA